MASQDQQVRTRAFEWLAEQAARHGDVLDWSLLSQGFEFGGRQVSLVGQRGIWKPALCALPLSICTSTRSPYDDHFVGDRLVYSYCGTDPAHPDNAGLRRLCQERIPLIYFHAHVKGRYHAVWPVLIVHDEPAALRFWVQAEPARLQLGGASITGPLDGASISNDDLRREYATRMVWQRLHQSDFRERVLAAYQQQCAMCHLRHRNLLDAAHIKPDSAGGEPVIPNGLSLCRIHHGAFDVGVLGVRPDTLRVHVRRDVLDEIDGPMLRHGLQALDGERLWTPRAAAKQPDPELLRWKWERFERAG